MGMYDHIRFEGQLPDGTSGEGREFQSKDLQCFLFRYTITGDGRLLESQWQSRYPEPALWSAPTPVEHTGDVEFYDEHQGRWRRYVAKFHQGKMVALGLDDAAT